MTRAQEYVMSHQLKDGSFGNLFDTNAVLPVLAGKSLLEVGKRSCPDEEMSSRGNSNFLKIFLNENISLIAHHK